MIGVVVPAHNEEELIGPCLDSIFFASRVPELSGESVEVIVVCDRCSDRTAFLARREGARVVTLRRGNVGRARAAGAKVALASGARWLAFTDADTTVSPTWLVDQLALQADAVCGTIGVSEWDEYGLHVQEHFAATYTDRDGHRHIHGANLGVSAAAYRRAGGFRFLAANEDVALVQVLKQNGARIAWSAAPRVTTSARKSFRTPTGFGETLMQIDKQQPRTTVNSLAVAAMAAA